jgi:hypothetical protein
MVLPTALTGLKKCDDREDTAVVVTFIGQLELGEDMLYVLLSVPSAEV